MNGNPLVDHEIEAQVRCQSIRIDPFLPELMQSNSYDVRLGNHIQRHIPGEDIVDVYDQESIKKAFREEYAGESFIIWPGEGILAETYETITLPDNVVATIEGKSSLARLFFKIHETGGWIDAGFSGTITLECTNSLKRPIKLYPGMTVGQLVFFQTAHARVPYNKKGSAKYLNQSGATISRYAANTPLMSTI